MDWSWGSAEFALDGGWIVYSGVAHTISSAVLAITKSEGVYSACIPGRCCSTYSACFPCYVDCDTRAW